MYIIGITGSLGAGKSTVAGMFVQRGARLIDADAITQGLLAPGHKCIKRVAKVFPDAILSSNRVDRCALAKIVFSHPRELKKLTNILYPEALKVVKKNISQYKHEPLIVLDVPLLFESGWDKITDTTIVVTAKYRQQLKRAQKRLGISQGQVIQRLRHQMPVRQKMGRADIIIDNSHGLKKTLAQVNTIIDRLKEKGII